MKTQRIALGVRYDGSRYHGWQVQDDITTVQQQLEIALSKVANHPVSLTCAGRTDAGVHASSQVVHFDTDAKRTEYSWMFGTNSNLPADISVTWAKEVSPDFHARYSATARTYRYIFYNHTVRPGILRHAIGWHYEPLDEHKMQEGAQYLIGKHDFTSFRGANCQAKTPVRIMHRLEIRRQRRMIIIEICANAFLLHMVRNIAGVLVAIGSGAKSPDWAKAVLDARDRKQAGPTVSPYGLYLVAVNYPPQFALPQQPIGPFFLP